MNNSVKNLFRLSLIGAALTLGGCDLMDSDNHGDEIIVDPEEPVVLVSFSGNALKGVLANADVNAYLSTDNDTVIATTTTDENGDYTLSFEQNDAGIYIVEVVANENTTMLCDADNCGTAENPIAFGETVPAAQLGDVTLSNLLFVEENLTDEPVDYSVQVNAVTSVATEVFVESLPEDTTEIGEIDAAGFANMQESVTVTVAALFGVDIAEGENVFELELPNMNDADELVAAEPSEAGFSIINAAIGTSSGDTVAESIDAVLEATAEVVATDSEESDNAWVAIQDEIMAEAVEITENENVVVSEEAQVAIEEIENADNNGVDLGAVDDAVDDTKEVIEDGGETGGTGTGGTGG